MTTNDRKPQTNDVTIAVVLAPFVVVLSAVGIDDVTDELF